VTWEVVVVVGARPNFVKAAPLVRALGAHGEIVVRVLHTGQHYDRALSGAFFDQLGMLEPDVHLAVGSGSHAEQTAAVMVGVERALSTLGASLAAAKLGVAVVHLEAGLRSRDWSMPEEINRVVADRVSDLLLCHCDEAVENLRAEGVPDGRIAMVGNTMIDSLFALRERARAAGALERLGLPRGAFVLVTLHRPALVDDGPRLAAVMEVIAELAERMPVVFPAHPRTRARLTGLDRHAGTSLQVVDPLEYLDFLCLEEAARVVVTDSGGVQEETSALGVACITYRETTERPVTVDLGTNRLVGVDPDALRAALDEELSGSARSSAPAIPLWDGHAGVRAADAVVTLLRSRE
jgi:UDP-N-acetylglucosamine 2-epimerase (non-hydrolysing)